MRRFAGLFDPHAPLTSPVGFLKRLHYKGVLYERERSYRFMVGLNRALASLLKIEGSVWLAKRYDFDQLWDGLSIPQRLAATVLLDASRHALDASVEKPEPFNQTGVVLFHKVDAWCDPKLFCDIILRLERLFPALQFFINLPRRFRRVMPKRFLGQTLAIGRPSASPASARRARLPPATILLVDVDSTLPNLALMKLSRYYKEQGKRVVLARRNTQLLGAEAVFASCVFAFPQSARRVETLRKFQFEQYARFEPDCRKVSVTRCELA